MGNIKIDTQKIDKAINTAFDKTCDRLNQAFDDAIADEIYSWPRETKRRNGRIAAGTRDIIDTRELLESKQVARSANAAEFSWNAPYSAAVHEGATTKSGVDLPARPWTEKAMEEVNPAEVFEQQLRKYL